MNAYQAEQTACYKKYIVEVNHIDRDNLVRKDTSLEKLAELPPVFDRSAQGTLTAGNSSPLTDGAAAVLLMSEQKAKELGYTPQAFIKAFAYTAIDPAEGLLMAPATAIPKVLDLAGLTLQDMNRIEIHEAFAAQVICNVRALEQGWKARPLGEFPHGKLNTQGGSIALGHPFAATGGRLVSSLACEMAEQGLQYGLISACAAGGMAAAMILEHA
jgi:acetyl-CoA acyltransferase